MAIWGSYEVVTLSPRREPLYSIRGALRSRAAGEHADAGVCTPAWLPSRALQVAIDCSACVVFCVCCSKSAVLPVASPGSLPEGSSPMAHSGSSGKASRLLMSAACCCTPLMVSSALLRSSACARYSCCFITMLLCSTSLTRSRVWCCSSLYSAFRVSLQFRSSRWAILRRSTCACSCSIRICIPMSPTVMPGASAQSKPASVLFATASGRRTSCAGVLYCSFLSAASPATSGFSTISSWVSW
mmetsp:Transcript_18202/g.46635  ORF Transcript_18202/g.46635 Transcript_18202/m.46635 type:complete len:243 (+) Transcript_18202:413-1141(+)